jgi:hypothetical protein
MAFGIAVYASQWRLPDTTQDSLPGAGQALPDGLSPAGLQQKVSSSHHVGVLLFQASWRNFVIKFWILRVWSFRKGEGGESIGFSAPTLGFSTIGLGLGILTVGFRGQILDFA